MGEAETAGFNGCIKDLAGQAPRGGSQSPSLAMRPHLEVVTALCVK